MCCFLLFLLLVYVIFFLFIIYFMLSFSEEQTYCALQRKTGTLAVAHFTALNDPSSNSLPESQASSNACHTDP